MRLHLFNPASSFIYALTPITLSVGVRAPFGGQLRHVGSHTERGRSPRLSHSGCLRLWTVEVARRHGDGGASCSEAVAHFWRLRRSVRGGSIHQDPGTSLLP